jgi:hypothetical protein
MGLNFLFIGSLWPQPLGIVIGPVEIVTRFVAFILTVLGSLGSPRQQGGNLLFTRRPETARSAQGSVISRRLSCDKITFIWRRAFI